MWDGDPTTFTEYAEIAGHWEQSVAYHKRYLWGPKLQAELAGTARRFVMSMAPGWISFDGGVDRLLSHLRMHLGQPQLSEISDYMARCFKMSKRKRHEAMNEYITKKAELYMRACQSLDRVQQRYPPERSKHGSSSNTSCRLPSRPGLTKDFLNSLDGGGLWWDQLPKKPANGKKKRSVVSMATGMFSTVAIRGLALRRVVDWFMGEAV